MLAVDFPLRLSYLLHVAPPVQRLTAWLCLLLYLFAGVAPAAGVVLCIEDDCRVTVEMHPQGAHCCKRVADESPSHGGQSRLESTERTCNCIDIPLVAQRDNAKPQLPQTAKRIAKVVSDLVTLPMASPAHFEIHACVGQVRDPSDPPASRFLDAHRFDVLLL